MSTIYIAQIILHLYKRIGHVADMLGLKGTVFLLTKVVVRWQKGPYERPQRLLPSSIVALHKLKGGQLSIIQICRSS